MAEYSNQFNISLNEIATIEFNHAFAEDKLEFVGSIVMHIGALEQFANTILDTLHKYEEKQKEVKKTLS